MTIDGKNLFDMSREELDILALNIRVAYKFLAKREATAFKPGDNVSFMSKRGTRIIGTVIDINTSTVSVKTDVGTYRVSPSLLTKQ